MDGILCLLAVQDGKVKRSSLEVLSRFREISDEHDLELSALLVGSDPGRYVNVAAAYGAERVFTIRHPLLDRHLNALLVDALAAAVDAAGAATLAMASTEAAKDVIGALGVRIGASVLPDVSSVERVDGAWEVRRPVMAAKRLARTRSLSSPTIISVRSGAYTASEAAVDADSVEIPFEVSEGRLRTAIQEVVSSASGTVDLSEARVVVAAGRGVRDEEGAALIRELASVLGGALGATRAVVEAGLFPATAQIGQTGKVVSPDLYIAVGISGAIQHVAGMSNSRIIVAINKDPEAPIFRYASFGVVGDLYTVVPLLVSELRAARAG